MAVQRGENTGDFHCIMRYDEADLLDLGEETTPSATYWDIVPYGEDPPRTKFCDDAQASNKKAGPPGEVLGKPGGNCLGQICVSDRYH